MAKERSGGDWRHPAGGKPQSTPGTQPPARNGNTSRRSWQPGGTQAPASTGKARSRGFRLLMAGAVTSALVALIVVVIWLFWPARYPQMALVGATTGDSLALPENVAGVNVATELSGWAGEGRGRDRPKLDANPVVTVDASGAKISIDPNPKNLVVYFTAHGGADANGAYLWMAPADSRGAADAHKVRVSDIIGRVGESRRDKATLLIFDATRVGVSWAHGMLFNDFARALKGLDSQIDAIPGLAVICASDDDQRSWVFEERKVSVFGHYLLEAMRGSGHDRGQRVTAASAFANAKTEVERWSIANRGEKQTPILLPQATGQGRAEKIDLAAAPANGYQSPSTIESPANVPTELEEAWKRANELAAQVPPPEANNPAKWREYLDLLVRYERLFRLGANTTAVRDRAAALAAQLQNPSIGREPACLPTAISTARALGRPPVFADARAAEAFRSTFKLKVWGSDKDKSLDRLGGWAALLRTYPGQETQIRTAGAELVVAQLVAEGATPANLAIADAVLATTHGTSGLPAPAEAHFVRMLHAHLDKTTRPDPALLSQALTLRKEAEETAWLFTDQPKEYSYSEYVYSWVRRHIEEGDRNRRLGEDLLFATDSQAWKEAEGYFDLARKEYLAARTNGRKVAAALAVRDKVFARLPYYGRWLATYRGSRPQTEVDRLLDRAEAAARDAHHLAEMTAKDPPPVDQLDVLDKLREGAAGHFKAITDAFDADIANLKNTPLPSNWHALDSALTVPFIEARRRAELLGFLRHVSYQLEINRQQPDGSQPPPPPVQQAAANNGRVALSLLGDTSQDRRQILDRPEREWWTAYRTVGDYIGDRYRGLAKVAKDKADESARKPILKESGESLAGAALCGRLVDPAAPLAGLDPVAADQRFRRHALLLWQAQRTTSEGWADVAPTTSDGWYCRKVAALLVGSAETLIRENAAEMMGRPVENMSPAELDRWLADCRAESKSRPVELKLNAPPGQEVADEPNWSFAFTLKTEKEKGAVGFPVSWLTVPPRPYPQPEPGSIGRKVESDLFAGRDEATRKARFIAVGPPQDVAGVGKLTSTVLYRGHLYKKDTEVVLVGTPTREVVHTPPKGPAAFGVLADRAAVAGSVTILIDLTGSMTTPLDQKNPNGANRIEEAKKGLELVLQQLPNGTKVTLAYFYGNGGRERTSTRVEPFGAHVELDGTNAGRVFNLVRRVSEETAVKDAAGNDVKVDGSNTPLAGAIREVLQKENVKKFWPENFTGSRTLIVLTDGEDNWDGFYDRPQMNRAGPVALKALLETPDDVNLHVVFFGLTSAAAKEEEERATKQFESLRDPANFRNPPRTPAQLWTGVHDANALADLCRRAMLPQFPYSTEKQLANPLEASLVKEGAMRSTPGLRPGVYNFWGLFGPQAIQLYPADRVLLQARKRDNKFELSLPAFAFDIARDKNLPRATNGTGKDGGIHATIPELQFSNKSNYAKLSLAVTLEPVSDGRAANHLEVARPKLAWFDVAYADGLPPAKGLTPCLRVENRWPVWAPAWNLDITPWEPGGTDREAARHPVVTAYWLNGFPQSAANYPVNLNDLSKSWEKLQDRLTVRVRKSEVTLLSIGSEEYSGPGLPAGTYLTVRIKYGKPGELVYLRPGNIKGTEQPYLLHERHVYYDAQMRYTARFGPIHNDDPNKEITMELYSVADLKEAQTTRSVTVRLPGGPLPQLEDMPQELRVEPRK